MLEWKKLLSGNRRKTLRGNSSGSMDTGQGREELERDYDRILFLAPVRRLADKTQVFPLDKNDSIRTRLTHSYEVSNLARSIGIRLAFDYADEVFGNDRSELVVERNVPALLAAVALAHDLGNPPFGHQGEVAIKEWFNEKNKKIFGKKYHKDFINFDGNAQTLRILTKLQILNNDYGLNLTCATLASIMKYPCLWNSKAFKKGRYKKIGVFESERNVVEEVWEETGLKEGYRHPFAYVMEACDDIAYSVVDAEDTIKKGYASFYDLIDYLEYKHDGDPIVSDVIKKAKGINKEYKNESLSSNELNDLSTQMFRVKAIFEMVRSVTKSFVSNIDPMMSGDLGGKFELIDDSDCQKLCKKLKDFSSRYGFKNNAVLKLELVGNNYIKSMMDMMWRAIDNYSNRSDPFAQYTYGRISENYRRVFESTDKKIYNKCQLLCDSISGMTDSYLISLHNELRPLCDGFRSKE